MWNKRFAQAVCTALIVMIFGSAGAVHAAGENQSPSDKAKYSSLSIAWSEPEELPILIRRAAVGPAAAFPVNVSDADRENSRNGVLKMLEFLRSGVADSLEPMLAKHGFTLIPSPDAEKTAEATLQIVAQSGSTECAPLGCQHGVMLSIALVDNASANTVWSGKFRVMPSWPSSPSPEVAEKFYRRLNERFLGKMLKKAD